MTAGEAMDLGHLSSVSGALAAHFVELGYLVPGSLWGGFWVRRPVGLKRVVVMQKGDLWQVSWVRGGEPVRTVLVEIALPDSVERVEGLVRGWLQEGVL